MIPLPSITAIRYRHRKEDRWTYQEGAVHARITGWAPAEYDNLYTGEQLQKLLQDIQSKHPEVKFQKIFEATLPDVPELGPELKALICK